MEREENLPARIKLLLEMDVKLLPLSVDEYVALIKFFHGSKKQEEKDKQWIQQ